MAAMFLNELLLLDRSPRRILKSDHLFLAIFEDFSIWLQRPYWLSPWRLCFWTNHDGLNSPGRDLSKNWFCKIILKSDHSFLIIRFFLSFPIWLYMQILPHPSWLWFLTNHDDLKNLGRSLPKDHCCKLSWKLTYQFFDNFSIWL